MASAAITPGHVFMFLLAGLVAVWGAWLTVVEPDAALTGIAIFLVGAAAIVLALAPLWRGGLESRLNRIHALEGQGLLSSEEAHALRAKLLEAA